MFVFVKESSESKDLLEIVLLSVPFLSDDSRNKCTVNKIDYGKVEVKPEVIQTTNLK